MLPTSESKALVAVKGVSDQTDECADNLTEHICLTSFFDPSYKNRRIYVDASKDALEITKFLAQTEREKEQLNPLFSKMEPYNFSINISDLDFNSLLSVLEKLVAIFQNDSIPLPNHRIYLFDHFSTEDGDRSLYIDADASIRDITYFLKKYSDEYGPKLRESIEAFLRDLAANKFVANGTVQHSFASADVSAAGKGSAAAAEIPPLETQDKELIRIASYLNSISGEPDPYMVFNMPMSASVKKIKSRYRALCKYFAYETGSGANYNKDLAQILHGCKDILKARGVTGL